MKDKTVGLVGQIGLMLLQLFTNGLLHWSSLADKGKVWGHLVPEFSQARTI